MENISYINSTDNGRESTSHLTSKLEQISQKDSYVEKWCKKGNRAVIKSDTQNQCNNSFQEKKLEMYFPNQYKTI